MTLDASYSLFAAPHTPIDGPGPRLRDVLRAATDEPAWALALDGAIVVRCHCGEEMRLPDHVSVDHRGVVHAAFQHPACGWTARSAVLDRWTRWHAASLETWRLRSRGEDR